MGLNIDAGKRVSLDDTHQKRVDTSIGKNPTRSDLGGLGATFIFRRNRTGDRDRDGNPLIYALKGMRGYRIEPDQKDRFMQRAIEIARALRGMDADLLMPIPSGNSFCAEFAACLADCLGIALQRPDFMRKKTVTMALAEAKACPPEINNTRTRRLYTSQLAAWERMSANRSVSMKEIDPKIRRFFNPMQITGDARPVNGRRVLLVDDLMSTGASMLGSAEVLRRQGAMVDQGVFFLSGL